MALEGFRVVEFPELPVPLPALGGIYGGCILPLRVLVLQLVLAPCNIWIKCSVFFHDYSLATKIVKFGLITNQSVSPPSSSSFSDIPAISSFVSLASSEISFLTVLFSRFMRSIDSSFSVCMSIIACN